MNVRYDRMAVKTGDDIDVLYGRRYLCVFKKAGVAAKAKRVIRRRARQMAKADLRNVN